MRSILHVEQDNSYTYCLSEYILCKQFILIESLPH